MASSVIFSFKFNPYVFGSFRRACLAPEANSYVNHLKIDRAWQRNFVNHEGNLSRWRSFSEGHGQKDPYRPEFISEGSKVVGVRTKDPPFKTIPSTENIIRYCDLSTSTYSNGCAKRGQKVAIHYRLYETNNFEKPEKEETKEIYLGKNDPFYPGLTEAIIGMKLNQVRRIVLPPELGCGKIFQSKKHRVFDVTLKNIIEQKESSTNKFSWLKFDSWFSM